MPERRLLRADLGDGHPQVAVPVDGVQAEVEVGVEDQHGAALEAGAVSAGGSGQCTTPAGRTARTNGPSLRRLEDVPPAAGAVGRRTRCGRSPPAAPSRTVRLQEQRHVRESVADRDRFDVRPDGPVALVGDERERLPGRQVELGGSSSSSRSGRGPRPGRAGRAGTGRGSAGGCGIE